MKLIIIRFNKLNLGIRSILLSISLLSMMLFIFDITSGSYSGIVFMLTIVLGAILKYFFKDYENSGEIILEDNKITLKENLQETGLEIPTSILYIKIFKSGYKWELYPYKFSTSGMFAFKSGANKIEFFTKDGRKIIKLFLVLNENTFYKLNEFMQEYRNKGVKIIYKNYKRFEI